MDFGQGHRRHEAVGPWDALEALLRYAQGARLATEPLLQEHLVEVFIELAIGRLFRMRNEGLCIAEVPITYEAAQNSFWTGRAGQRLATVIGEVAGPYALLSQEDPWSLSGGALERYLRQPSPAPDYDAGEMAAALGLSGNLARQERAWDVPATAVAVTGPATL